MPPKKARVPRRLFSEGFARSRAFHGRLLTLRIAPCDGPARVSVVVSKKVAKSAAARNLLRRRLYHALTAMLRGRKNITVLCFTKGEAAEAPYAELSAEVLMLLKKAL